MSIKNLKAEQLPSSAEEGSLRGSRKSREASVARADGVVLVNHRLFFDQHHPGRSFQRWLRDIFLMSRPPLLS